MHDASLEVRDGVHLLSDVFGDLATDLSTISERNAKQYFINIAHALHYIAYLNNDAFERGSFSIEDKDGKLYNFFKVLISKINHDIVDDAPITYSEIFQNMYEYKTAYKRFSSHYKEEQKTKSQFGINFSDSDLPHEKQTILFGYVASVGKIFFKLEEHGTTGVQDTITHSFDFLAPVPEGIVDKSEKRLDRALKERIDALKSIANIPGKLREDLSEEEKTKLKVIKFPREVYNIIASKLTEDGQKLAKIILQTDVENIVDDDSVMLLKEGLWVESHKGQALTESVMLLKDGSEFVLTKKLLKEAVERIRPKGTEVEELTMSQIEEREVPWLGKAQSVSIASVMDDSLEKKPVGADAKKGLDTTIFNMSTGESSLEESTARTDKIKAPTIGLSSVMISVVVGGITYKVEIESDGLEVRGEIFEDKLVIFDTGKTIAKIISEKIPDDSYLAATPLAMHPKAEECDISSILLHEDEVSGVHCHDAATQTKDSDTFNEDIRINSLLSEPNPKLEGIEKNFFGFGYSFSNEPVLAISDEAPKDISLQTNYYIDEVATLMLLNEHFGQYLPSKILTYTFEIILAVFISRIGGDLGFQNWHLPFVRAGIFITKDFVWNNKKSYILILNSFVTEELQDQYHNEIKLVVDIVLDFASSSTSPFPYTTLISSSLNSVVNYLDDGSFQVTNWSSFAGATLSVISLACNSRTLLGHNTYYQKTAAMLTAMYLYNLGYKAANILQGTSKPEELWLEDDELVVYDVDSSDAHT